MNATDFIAEIRRRAGCRSDDAALRASRATLVTLGERLAGHQTRRLAEQLPPEIGGCLLGARPAGGAELSPGEFLRRVSEREGVDLRTARRHAQAVVEVLHEAVCQAQWRLLRRH